MKICPSCNARVVENRSDCSSCGYSFAEEEEAQRDTKKTMMGIPALFDQEQGERASDDSQGGEARRTYFGLPAIVGDEEERREEEPRPGEAKTEMVSVEDLPMMPGMVELGTEPSEESTRQFDTNRLAAAMRDADPKATAFGMPSPFMGDSEVGDSEMGDGDSEGEAMSAWGIVEESESEADMGAGATQVISPEALTFSYDKEAQAGSMSIPKSSKPEKESPQRDHRTLMGMSLEEVTGDLAAGMMQRPVAEEEEYDDSPTQALGPDQLVGLDEQMLKKQQPGRSAQATPVAEELATAILSGAGTPDLRSFQLPKPALEEDSDEDDLSESSGKRRDTPRSGVFRVPRRRETTPPKDGGPTTDRVGEPGLGGTGTYRVGQGKSEIKSESPFDTSSGTGGSVNLEGPLAGGGRGRTSFPTGGITDQQEAKRQPVASPVGAGRSEISTTQRGRPVSESDGFARRPTPGSGFVEEIRGRRRFSGGIDEASSSSIAGPTEEVGVTEEVGQKIEPEPTERSMPVPDLAPDLHEEPAFPLPSQESAASYEAASFGAEPMAGQAMTTPRVVDDGAPAPVAAATQAPAVQEQKQKQTLAGAQSASPSNLVDLGQKGLALFGAVVLMGATMAALLLEGVPEAMSALVLTATPALWAIVAVLIAALPLPEKGRSLGLGVVALVALVGCGAAVVFGAALVATIGQAFGGLLVACAAVFPLLKSS